MKGSEPTFEPCQDCEGSGDHHEHRPDFYDPYYMHRFYGRPCEHCDGKGKIEVEPQEDDGLSKEREGA